MSILTGFKKVKNYILTSSGYQLLSRWTSSQTVEFDDGKTAQAKLGEINGIAKTYVDMKKATDNSMAVSAKAVMEGLENSSALISMTQAEYDALSDEEKTDNNMRAILDANPDVVDAKNVNFDNTNTNLIATNTQSAITELNGKLVSLDNVASMVINTDNNSATFKLKLAPSGTYIRYTALLVLCNQHAGFVGAYVIGVNDVGENIHKIAGENATISRNGDNVIVVFGENSIWSTGLLIAPRILVQ